MCMIFGVLTLRVARAFAAILANIRLSAAAFVSPSCVAKAQLRLATLLPQSPPVRFNLLHGIERSVPRCCNHAASVAR